MAGSGHRSVPHTADLRVEAWAGTRDECLAAAVRGVVSAFADTTDLPPRHEATTRITGRDDADLVVAALDEVVYLLDTTGEVPVTVSVVPVGSTVAGTTELDLRFGLARLTPDRTVGATPKAATLHGLEFARHDGQWRCTVILDV